MGSTLVVIERRPGSAVSSWGCSRGASGTHRDELRAGADIVSVWKPTWLETKPARSLRAGCDVSLHSAERGPVTQPVPEEGDHHGRPTARAEFEGMRQDRPRTSDTRIAYYTWLDGCITWGSIEPISFTRHRGLAGGIDNLALAMIPAPRHSST